MSSNLNQVIFLNPFIILSICDLFKIRIFVVQSTSQLYIVALHRWL